MCFLLLSPKVYIDEKSWKSRKTFSIISTILKIIFFVEFSCFVENIQELYFFEARTSPRSRFLKWERNHATKISDTIRKPSASEPVCCAIPSYIPSLWQKCCFGVHPATIFRQIRQISVIFVYFWRKDKPKSKKSSDWHKNLGIWCNIDCESFLSSYAAHIF